MECVCDVQQDLRGLEGAEGRAKGFNASQETCMMPDQIDFDHQTLLKTIIPADAFALSITPLHCNA